MLSSEVSAYRAGFTPLATLRSSSSAEAQPDGRVNRLAFLLQAPRDEVLERIRAAVLLDDLQKLEKDLAQDIENNSKKKLEREKRTHDLKKRKIVIKLGVFALSSLLTIAANIVMFIDYNKNNKDFKKSLVLLVVTVSLITLTIFLDLANLKFKNLQNKKFKNLQIKMIMMQKKDE